MTTITAPGFYPDITSKQNFAGVTPTRALTNSGIKILLNETPADLVGKDDTDTVAKRLGDVTHQLILGKGKGFAVSPFAEYRSNDAKAWKADVESKGLVPIKEDDARAAKAMADIAKERIAKIVGGNPYQTELVFAWIEETAHGSVWCAGMADIWCPALGLVIDPKITKMLHGTDRLRAHISTIGWHTQNAWYRRGLSKITGDHRIRFANLMISPDKPYSSRLIEISEAWRTGAERDCERALNIFGRCMALDEWPGYPDQEILDEPSWKMNARLMAEMEESEGE